MTTPFDPKQLLAQIQHDALAEYLSRFPEHMSYERVLTLLSIADERVLVWGAFDNHSPEQVIELIEGRLDANKRILALVGINLEG